MSCIFTRSSKGPRRYIRSATSSRIWRPATKTAGLSTRLRTSASSSRRCPYSRDVEAAADHKGAITCAQAGSNPWGMVRLFQRFETIDTNAPPEFISDHPTNQARIAALEQAFRSNVALFGRYSPNIATATPPTVAARGAAAAHAAPHKAVVKKH
jgi:predicted Zn-dependent protease